MLLFIPRSLCALKRIAAKAEHSRYGATQGIRFSQVSGIYRAEATDGLRAILVQGLTPLEDPPWPGFKELPDDACETIILPKDLERACKVGDESLQSRFGMVGIATNGEGVSLGLGADVVTTRVVDGRFPNVEKVIPKKRPVCSFRVDPQLLADTLLAIAELLPEHSREVQCFYYGDGQPLGFCAKNIETGMMIDALVVPLVVATPTKEKAPEQPKAGTPEANGQADAKQEETSVDSNGQDVKKKARKVKA